MKQLSSFARGSYAALFATLVSCVGGAPDQQPPCGADCEKVVQERARILRDNLLGNLRGVMNRGHVIFGQQRFNVTGVRADGSQWLATEAALDQSNVKELTGKHPGVLGIDAWDLAIKPATWSPSPFVHALAARHVYSQGGVITFEWHMRGCDADELFGAGFYADGNEDCLCRLANDEWFARQWLLDGKMARFANALEAYGLAEVPIIFRPLHEFTGGWFWWGYPYWDCEGRVADATVSGPAAYKKVFRMMVDYLRVERQLDNVLVAYSPDKLERGIGDDPEARYLSGYPGDDYVDILGIDLYYLKDRDFAEQTQRYRSYLELLTRLARERGKVAALTETGNYRLADETSAADSTWFSQHLLPLVVGNPNIRLAYVLTWENRQGASQNFYVPYGDHAGVADFRAFFDAAGTLFLGGLGDLYATPDDGPTNDPLVCSSCDADPDGDGVGFEDGVVCVASPECLQPEEYPACERCESDPDGDGWGWENEQSCYVPSSCAEDVGHPTCERCASDPDGDGWGWENEQSCVVPPSCIEDDGYPTCEYCESDPDGDGWGWENEQSCRVAPTC